MVSRSDTGHYVPTLVFGALHQVVPDRVMAGVGSPLWAVTQSGVREDGRTYTNVLFYNGGMGATSSQGRRERAVVAQQHLVDPVEVAERNSPLFFHYKRMRSGSGGAGRFRGGLGQDILMESESEAPIAMVFMAERTKFPRARLRGRRRRRAGRRAHQRQARSTTGGSTSSSAATRCSSARRVAAATARGSSAMEAGAARPRAGLRARAPSPRLSRYSRSSCSTIFQ